MSLQYFIYTLKPGFAILTVLYIYLYPRVWYHYSTLYIPWYQGLISEDSTRLTPLDGSGRISGCLCMRLVQQLKYGDQFFGSRTPEYRIQYIRETWIKITNKSRKPEYRIQVYPGILNINTNISRSPEYRIQIYPGNLNIECKYIQESWI